MSELLAQPRLALCFSRKTEALYLPQLQMYLEEVDYPPETRGQTMIDWNAETEQWEVDGKKFEGEILWCNGWHDGLNIHDPWWCLWRTETAISTYNLEAEK